MDKAEKAIHQVVLHATTLGVGFVLAYLLCWVFESGVDGHTVTRWSVGRCGYAVMVTLFAWLFARHASGERE